MSNLKLDGFFGLEFGSSMQAAKEKLGSRDGSILDEINSNDETLFYQGLKFAGRETEMIMLLFHEDKFCKSAVYIKPKLESQAIKVYREVQGEINNKYYSTDQDYETYHYPYEKDDGYVETAIKMGKADFSSFWNFKDPSGQDDYISLKINEELYIILTYEDGDLIELLVNKRKATDSLDY